MKKKQFSIIVFRSFVVLVLLFIVVSQPANADPFTVGNILVSSRDILFEYTPFGAQVQSIAVPYPPPQESTENVRDIIVDQHGDVQVYNGTFDPYLSTYNPSSDTWLHHTHVGWSTVNNVSYGGIGTYQNFAYVTDMRTFGDDGQDEAKGIVRFNIDTFFSQRFAEAFEFIDLTIGMDGLLYGLLDDEDTINVYDPLSMVLLGTISLETDVRGIAVNEVGEIFGASWDGNIYHFDNDGVIQNSIDSGSHDLVDIDISLDGQLVIGSRFGYVFLTDESLGSVSSFSVGSEPTFVAYVSSMAPHIDKLRPRRCEPGKRIRIVGYGFGEIQGDSLVHIGNRIFDSSSPRIKLWTDTKIKIRIPNYKCEWFKGQDYRRRKVWVTVDGVDSNKKRLKVMKPCVCE
jgi:hypothetical protein